MSGNRKYGYARGNRGGFKPQPWQCTGCGKDHPGARMRNRALDGHDYCDRTYEAARARGAATDQDT